MADPTDEADLVKPARPSTAVGGADLPGGAQVEATALSYGAGGGGEGRISDDLRIDRRGASSFILSRQPGGDYLRLTRNAVGREREAVRGHGGFRLAYTYSEADDAPSGVWTAWDDRETWSRVVDDPTPPGVWTKRLSPLGEQCRLPSPIHGATVLYVRGDAESETPGSRAACEIRRHFLGFPQSEPLSAERYASVASLWLSEDGAYVLAAAQMPDGRWVFDERDLKTIEQDEYALWRWAPESEGGAALTPRSAIHWGRDILYVAATENTAEAHLYRLWRDLAGSPARVTRLTRRPGGYERLAIRAGRPWLCSRGRWRLVDPDRCSPGQPPAPPVAAAPATEALLRRQAALNDFPGPSDPMTEVELGVIASLLELAARADRMRAEPRSEGVTSLSAADDWWVALERSRIGLAVELGVVAPSAWPELGLVPSATH